MDLPLHSLHAASGAEFTRFGGYSVAASYTGDAKSEYTALHNSAGLTDLSYRRIFRLKGKDVNDIIAMLQAVTTNDVPKNPETGVYAALLNPKGRIRADLRILKTGQTVIVDTEPEGGPAVEEILGRYAPFSRVTLEDISSGWGELGLYGPHAPAILNYPPLTENTTAEVAFSGISLLAAGVVHPVPGYNLLAPVDILRRVWDRLIEAGAAPVGLYALESARVEAGIPRFGADITEDNFPGEAGILDRAVSFTKGCYPGQETVARMHYRGHPNKTLHRLIITEGPLPTSETPILQNGKQAGTITSVAPIPVDGRILALGYLSRAADLQATLRAGDAFVYVNGST